MPAGSAFIVNQNIPGGVINAEAGDLDTWVGIVRRVLRDAPVILFTVTNIEDSLQGTQELFGSDFTGNGIVVVFLTHDMAAIAQKLRKKYPDLRLVMVTSRHLSSEEAEGIVISKTGSNVVQ